jgi:hypothetical protein
LDKVEGEVTVLLEEPHELVTSQQARIVVIAGKVRRRWVARPLRIFGTAVVSVTEEAVLSRCLPMAV